jgi:hypothetical protein
LYITFMLAIVQSKIFFSLVLVWRDGHGVQRSSFSFGAIPIGWRMEKHRARWSFLRWLLACLRLYVFTGEIFCISSNKNIQTTTKVQTFTHFAFFMSPIPQFSIPPTFISLITRITNSHHPPSRHTSPQYSVNPSYHPTQSPRHPLTVGIVYRNPPSPNFGPSARGLGCLQRITLVLYHAPLIQP